MYLVVIIIIESYCFLTWNQSYQISILPIIQFLMLIQKLQIYFYYGFLFNSKKIICYWRKSYVGFHQPMIMLA